MAKWSTLSVRTKLTLLTMATSASALTMTIGGVILNEMSSARTQLTAQLQAVTDVVAASSAAAVRFTDAQAATEALLALKASPFIEGAHIDLATGEVLARYGTELAVEPAGEDQASVVDVGRSVIVSRPIVLDARTIGLLHVQGSLRGVDERLRRYGLILALVVGVASLVAFVLSSLLQRAVSGPITRLSSTARLIAKNQDYTIRAVKEHDDELGQLVDQFNDMLSTIELRDDQLQQAHGRLEERVAERTRTLELEIEERRRTETQLKEAKLAAEQASIAKSAFLANMSHELRTPLNAIIGYSEMLKEEAEGRADSEFAPDLEKILTSGRHLLALINHVLDLSKIEAGRMELDTSEFDFDELVQSAAATAQTLAARRGNTLVVEPAGRIGVVCLDRTKVQQVLLNLLGNACKFTERGRVWLRVARTAGDAGDDVVVQVVDTGIGMTPEQAGRLFQEFMQGDASMTRRYGGTGLGLAISQRLCALMGGSIGVKSRPGEGSTFTVRLPVQMAAAGSAERPRASRDAVALAPAPPLPPRQAVATRPASPPPVLIVDDDANARDLARRVLARAGYAVETAISADEALRRIQDVAPCAVVLDVILPGRSGWTLLESLRRTPGLAQVPVIVVSMLDNETRSLELGATAHLTKPIDAGRLLSTMAAVLNEPDDRSSPPRAEADPASAA